MPLRSVTAADTVMDRTVGNVRRIQQLAGALKSSHSERDTLTAIHQYLKSICVADAFWDDSVLRGDRKSSDMLTPNSAWGCSAHAQVACHLVRATGIPAILAKSVDASWLDTGDRSKGRATGHVYVEILFNGQAALWNAGTNELHTNYNPSALIDGRRIYDTGSPDEVILSHHGNQWETEVLNRFPPR